MTTDQHLKEAQLTSQRVYSGNFLQVQRDTVQLPDGSQATREYIVHPGAVMIIALLDDQQVVLERQYRYPHHRAFIEFPAGKIDAHEAPLDTAMRELKEETGYSARYWKKLGVIHNAISYSDEHIELYLATGLTAGVAQLDTGEFLDVFTMPAQQLIKLVGDGKVTDVKTMIGAFWLEKILHGQWSSP